MKKYTITDKEWESVLNKVQTLEKENQRLTGVMEGMNKAFSSQWDHFHRINKNDMTNKERNLIKKKIVKCLTEDFKNNQAIFNKKEGWQVFNGTDLDMVMDKVVKGLEMAKHELHVDSYSQEEIKAAYDKGLEDGYACMPSNL